MVGSGSAGGGDSERSGRGTRSARGTSIGGCACPAGNSWATVPTGGGPACSLSVRRGGCRRGHTRHDERGEGSGDNRPLDRPPGGGAESGGGTAAPAPLGERGGGGGRRG